MENNFFAICYDCLYYGYTKKFIFEQYKDIIKALGEETAKSIYNKAFDKITNEF